MRALGKGSIAEIIRVGLVIAWIVLWVAAAALVAMAVAYALHLGGIVDFGKMFGPDARIRIDENVVVSPITTPSWPVVVPAFLIGAVVVSGGMMIVWRLRKLFDSFCSGEPFAQENAAHLRAIWMTMIGIEMARYLLLALTGFLLLHFGGPLAQSTQIRLSVNLSTWASILILVVLAEVFREGARMKAEQELTI
ncbi:MAG: DUF2975 domain-containing protein [Proteobacteria bacterium]|nr:DUF2975 domain-containing protein [Pseudomonadota bacterium]